MNIKEIVEKDRKVAFYCGTPALVNDFLLYCIEQNLPLYSSKFDTQNVELLAKRMIKATKNNIHLLISENTVQVGMYPYRDNLYFLYTSTQEEVDKSNGSTHFTVNEYKVFNIKEFVRDIKIDNIIQ